MVLNYCAAANVMPFGNSMERPVDTTSTSEEFVPIVRDRNGRMLVPVVINGKGPYSLILDTGATSSAVSSEVAASLGATLDQIPPTIVHGVTGSTVVPTIQIESMSVGAFTTTPKSLPLVLDALDGADGFLSTINLAGKRIVIDLKNDLLSLSDRPSIGPARRDVTLRAALSGPGMLIIEARINGVPVQTIVDTGAQATIGNLAMQAALGDTWSATLPKHQVIGATAEMQPGASYRLAPIALGSLRILGTRICYADVPIFRTLKLASSPAMLVGMDILGQFESLILDYQRQTLRLRPRATERS